jgi:hypothetical protein
MDGEFTCVHTCMIIPKYITHVGAINGGKAIAHHDQQTRPWDGLPANLVKLAARTAPRPAAATLLFMHSTVVAAATD